MGDAGLLGNFCPITLESVALKIFSSLLCNKIYEFLSKNNFVENHYQKVFTPKMSRTFEHITEMGHMINHARIKQKSLTITLIDFLKNAVLYDNICELVHYLYNNFQISICYHHKILLYTVYGSQKRCSSW